MAYSPKNLVEVIKQNRNKKMVAKTIVESNPQAITILPKLTKDVRGVNPDDGLSNANLNRNLLDTIRHQLETNRQNNKNIIKLFPDLEMGVQILVSAVLSPKKMTDAELLYKFNKGVNVSPKISSLLLTKIKDVVNTEYELEDKLTEIVREALFQSGSYITAVIPEASVDEVINSDLLRSYSSESHATIDRYVGRLVDPINLISKQRHSKPITDLESFAKHLCSESLFKLTDNPQMLRFNSIKSRMESELVKNSYRNGTSFTTESREGIKYLDIFRNRNTGSDIDKVVSIKTRNETKRKSLGRPMCIKLPSSAVMPITTPGNETNHMGYLVLLDGNGKPINGEASGIDRDSQDFNKLNYDSGSSVTPVQLAYKNLIADTNAKVNVNDLFEIYKNIVESQLFEDIKGAMNGKDIHIANKNDIFFLMFCRALEGRTTSMLYLPAELVTYTAFYYNEYGIGKSLLDNLSIVSSLRAIMLFSKVMAYSKMAIDVTKVNVELSPEDVDPEATIQKVQDGVLKLRQNFFPLGINNPIDLVNWIQRAGLQFAYSNNPLLPDVNINFENSNLEHKIPESELEDTLRKQMFQTIGVPPEVIDQAFSPEFATSVVNNNLLLSKRVMVYQKALCKSLSKFVGCLLYNDMGLRESLKDILKANNGEVYRELNESMKQEQTKSEDDFIEDFLDKLSQNVIIELPKPDNTNLMNLTADFNVYKEGLEAVLGSVVGGEIVTEDIGGVLSEHADTIANLYKHSKLRKWCAENNYFPEIMGFMNNESNETKRELDILLKDIKGSMVNSVKLLKAMESFKEAIDKDLAEVEGSGGSLSDGGGDGRSEVGNGDEGSDGEGGDDDLDSEEDAVSLDF